MKMHNSKNNKGDDKKTPPCIIYALMLILLTGLGAQRSFAGEKIEKTVIGKSGYPVPRFVSLASHKVNVRTGPDKKYPIKWVFKKAGLPVKVIREYGKWRKIVDSEGESGWIWEKLLSLRRNGLIVAERQPLLRNPEPDQPPAVIAEAGVIGKIKSCTHGWCKLDVNGFTGWLKQTHFWGTLDQEEIE